MDNFKKYMSIIENKISSKVNESKFDTLEEEIWNNAKLFDTLKSYARYIENYPNGIYITVAKQKYEEKEKLIPLIHWINSYDISLDSYKEIIYPSSKGVKIIEQNLIRHSIIKLYISDSLLTNIPKEIEMMNNLKTITITNTESIEFPTSMKKLNNLTLLSIDCNNISESICNLHNLEILHIYGNITKLPDCIGNLSNLKEINILCTHRLTRIPESFRKLKFLENFRIRPNQFSNFKESITYVKSYKEDIEKSSKQEKMYWNEAQHVNTQNSYTVYLQRYPNGKYILEANKRIENIAYKEENEAWEKAQTTNAIDAQIYIGKYPNGKFKKEAYSLIEKCDFEYYTQEKDDWDNIPQYNSQDCESFLKRYPNSKYKNEVIRKKKEFEEKEFWRDIYSGRLGEVEKIENTYLEMYLVLYPNGIYSIEAKQKLKKRKFLGLF